MRTLGRTRDWIRSRPALYDALKPLKRRYLRETDSIYDWFDAFSRSCPRLKFAQIGAADGLRNDPIREFVIRDKWSGVLVEPLPTVFELLKHNYAGCAGLTFVNGAIGPSSGSLSFWTFQPAFLANLTHERQLDYLRKASFDREQVLRYLKPTDRAESALLEIKVPTYGVNDFLLEHFPNGLLDLLAIDAEGHDAAIIRALDHSRVRVRAIFFESRHLHDGYEPLAAMLQKNGYRIESLGGDTVAVR